MVNMIFIRSCTPFANSIYEIHDLSADLNLIQQGIDHYIKADHWIYRDFSKQTPNLKEVIPEFEGLFEKIDDAVQWILNTWDIKAKATRSLHFINIDGNYSNSEVHCHANCILSGVFYVNAPEGSGDINFYRPDSQEYQFKAQNYNNPYINRKYSIKPRSNMAIIFPPHMKHGVGVSKIADHESRISISFDYTLQE